MIDFREGTNLMLSTRAIAFVLAIFGMAGATGSPVAAAEASAERGAYLVALGGCSDCHTPGVFLGHPDKNRFLGGSDVGFAIPGLGVFVGPNLTPDRDTGLGSWTNEQIVTAIRSGKVPDGRTLAPVMPWNSFSKLSDGDAMSIALYLKSLPAVAHRVGGPFGSKEKVTSFVMTVLPADAYNKMNAQLQPAAP